MIAISWSVEQDGLALPHPRLDALQQLLLHQRVYPGERFVEQDQVGFDHAQAQELDQFLLPVGEVRGVLVRQAAQAQLVQQLLRQCLGTVEAVLRDDAQVLQHRHRRKEASELEGAPHAHRIDEVRRTPGDVLALVDDLAAVRRFQPGDEVEHRRLAGAVRADDAGDLAALDLEAGAVNRLDAAEALRDVADVQDDVCRGGCGCAHMRRLLGRMFQPCSSESNPPGMKRTTRMMIPP